MKEVKVSVIVPVYNGEAYIRQCVESILDQSLREVQVICVDDGSTDTERYRSWKNSVKRMTDCRS